MRKRKKILPIIEILLLAFIIYLISQNFAMGKKQAFLEDQIDQKLVKQEEIEDDILTVQDELDEENTLKYIERIARDEYGMVKPKEVVFKDQESEE